MIVKLFSTLTAAAVAITLGANTAQAALPNDHKPLLQSVLDAGVRVYVNTQHCEQNEHLNGFYISQASVLVVCQDNMKEVGEETVWSANDLDTLRHESHHLLQDCLVTRGDGKMDPLFPDTLEQFIRQSSLTPEAVRRIIAIYLQNGADTDTVELELEAFAVAADVAPGDIAKGIDKFCAK